MTKVYLVKKEVTETVLCGERRCENKKIVFIALWYKAAINILWGFKCVWMFLKPGHGILIHSELCPLWHITLKHVLIKDKQTNTIWDSDHAIPISLVAQQLHSKVKSRPTFKVSKILLFPITPKNPLIRMRTINKFSK